MFDPNNAPRSHFAQLAVVIETALAATDTAAPSDVMIVGARCRDIMHLALGHTFDTTVTHDLDLALALSSWRSFRSMAAAFPRLGNTGIRFKIADVAVDLLPFGDVEDPPGTVEPPTRGERLSVWAFDEIFAAALPLTLSSTTTIRIPTVAGYAAAKLGAWLDRSDWREAKDAADLALIMYWYAESGPVQDRLYDTSAGNDLLIAEAADVQLAAARLLGHEIAVTIGAERLAELLARWPGNRGLLIRELAVRGGPAWPGTPSRRSDLADALTRGLNDSGRLT